MDTKTENKELRALLSDPSSLTTQQLWREIQNLKEFLETRIDGIEKSIGVAHDDMVRVPTQVQQQVGNLRDLHDQRFSQEASLRDEKFASVQKQFDGNKTAVDAALAAVKEAGNKTESAFIKQIDQLVLLFNTTTKALEGQIDELKARLNRGEGKGEGSREGKTAQQDSTKYIIAIVVFIIMVFGFIVGRGGV